MGDQVHLVLLGHRVHLGKQATMVLLGQRVILARLVYVVVPEGHHLRKALCLRRLHRDEVLDKCRTCCRQITTREACGGSPSPRCRQRSSHSLRCGLIEHEANRV